MLSIRAERVEGIQGDAAIDAHDFIYATAGLKNKTRHDQTALRPTRPTARHDDVGRGLVLRTRLEGGL